MAIRLGLDCKLYIDEESGYATPDWGEVTNCKDLTLSLEKNEADVTVRGNNGWRAVVAVLKDSTIEFKMIYDTSDTLFTMIQTAYLAQSFPNNSLYVAVMDGDITVAGSQGIWSMMIVSGFTINQPLEEAATVDVKMRPTYFPAAPTEWKTIVA